MVWYMDAMADDLHALTARVDALISALVALGEGQRDTVDALLALQKALIVLETKGDLRATQHEKIAGVIAKIERAVSSIEKPVVSHYDGLRIAHETEAANAGKWATILSPERIVGVLRYALPILAALAAGGFGGGYLRDVTAPPVAAPILSPLPPEVAP